MRGGYTRRRIFEGEKLFGRSRGLLISKIRGEIYITMEPVRICITMEIYGHLRITKNLILILIVEIGKVEGTSCRKNVIQKILKRMEVEEFRVFRYFAFLMNIQIIRIRFFQVNNTPHKVELIHNT